MVAKELWFEIHSVAGAIRRGHHAVSGQDGLHPEVIVPAHISTESNPCLSGIRIQDGLHSNSQQRDTQMTTFPRYLGPIFAAALLLGLSACDDGVTEKTPKKAYKRRIKGGDWGFKNNLILV